VVDIATLTLLVSNSSSDRGARNNSQFSTRGRLRHQHIKKRMFNISRSTEAALRCNAMQCLALRRCAALGFNAIRCGAVLCVIILSDAVRSVQRRGALHRDAMRCAATRCGALPFGIVRYIPFLDKSVCVSVYLSVYLSVSVLARVSVCEFLLV